MTWVAFGRAVLCGLGWHQVERHPHRPDLLRCCWCGIDDRDEDWLLWP